MSTRLEHDLLGERQVPAERYYGIQTLRASENFAITGVLLSHYPRLIRSLAYIKKAAALTNRDLGLLSDEIAGAIAGVTGRRLRMTKGPPREGDIRHSFADISQARRLLGFRPHTTLEEGLRIFASAL